MIAILLSAPTQAAHVTRVRVKLKVRERIFQRSKKFSESGKIIGRKGKIIGRKGKSIFVFKVGRREEKINFHQSIIEFSLKQAAKWILINLQRVEFKVRAFMAAVWLANDLIVSLFYFSTRNRFEVKVNLNFRTLNLNFFLAIFSF
jgi:hypothetical protein